MAYYRSYGAAGEVTGSCHLLIIGKIKILIDCGMFQGAQEALNFEPFAFNPKDINYLIVTHAHIDHIGRIPLLVKNGFDKKIISTRATFSIAQLMLKNSAGILETKKEQLYTTKDVDPALELFGNFLEYGESMTLDKNIKITFKNAGHILGAVSVKIKFFDKGIKKSVIFSGDIGQRERIITSQIEFWKKSNYIFLESTYGLSVHEELDISIKSFKKQILKTIKKGGTVVIPSFALERTQEILYLLRQMSNNGKLKNIPVFLDSPLAINVTRTFLNYPHLFNKEVKKIIQRGENPFDFKELTNTYSKESSQHINSFSGAKIIIAGSGMCEGGRVGYHLVRYLQDKNNLVLFVGFQVNSTLGQKISSGERDLSILGSDIHVRAKIGYVSGFSAHADQKELLEWVDAVDNIYCVYLIHGDIPQLKTLKQKVKTQLKEKVHIVKMGEQIHL
ncbi:MAG: MBL fold metallo-hydrolase [Arcobacteraceae bacterium]|nr:MBL fold metallo-hydrolase [Arcobacteraceae bacterium]